MLLIHGTEGSSVQGHEVRGIGAGAEHGFPLGKVVSLLSPRSGAFLRRLPGTSAILFFGKARPRAAQ